MIGKWKIVVDTPFGEEVYQMDVFKDADGIYGCIANDKGFLNFKDAELAGNIFSWSAKTTVPIDANVFFVATLDDEHMHGKIKIDDYVQVQFKGEK